MEVALTVAFLLTEFEPALCSVSDQNGQVHQQRQFAASVEGADVRQALHHPEEQIGTQIPAGDPNGLLPVSETRRQVGIRWPQSPCEVVFRHKSAHCETC